MTVALAALAVLVGLPFLSATVIAEALRLPWWLLAIGFAPTEACVLHIQLKREAQTVRLSRAPWNFGGGPLCVRLRRRRQCARWCPRFQRSRRRARRAAWPGAGGR